MKKFIHLITAALATFATMAHAGSTIHSVSVQSADQINDAFIGDSIGWEVRVHNDQRTWTIARHAAYATATDLIFVTPSGLMAYDIARDGKATPNDDRRTMRNGGTLELAPLRVSVLELPGEVKEVAWTRPLALQILTVVDHRYVALKYVPLTDLKIKGPRRLTITTDSGKYSFDVAAGAGGAPIYRVVDGN